MNEKSRCTKRMNRKFWDHFLHKRQSEEVVKVQQPFERQEIDHGWATADKYDASDSGLSDSGSSPEPSTSNIGRVSTLVASGSSTDIASNAVALLPDRPQDLEAVLPSLTQTASSDVFSSLNEEDAPGPFERLVSCLAIERPDYSFHQLLETLSAVRQHPSVITYHKIQRFCQTSSKRSVSCAPLHNTLSQEEPIDYSAKVKTSFNFQTKEEFGALSAGPSISCDSQQLPGQGTLKSRFDAGTEKDSGRSSIAAEELNSLREEECLQSYKNNHNLMSVIDEPGIGLTEDQEIALFTHILKHSKQEVATEDSQVVMDIVQKSFSKKSIPVQEMSNMPIVGKGESASDLFARALVSTGSRRPRGEKRPIPESQKDDKYFERRRRNNLAAKKSRDNRKKREDLIAERAGFLERENAILRAQVATMREEAANLRTVLFQRKPEIIHLKQRSSIYLDGDAIVPE
ncbi:uncharacterized protein LOC135222933 [Macrobrachium nipponense]|uniref:uncharacterized protein LOC135222933 n=1 Tax=Macrobrachium nipponense TaxID=159736 RepID=UPI0030C7F4EE